MPQSSVACLQATEAKDESDERRQRAYLLNTMKVICLIVDAMGIGPMEDVPTQGCLANTVVHVCERERELHLPNFEALGLGILRITPYIKAVGTAAIASYGRLNPR